MSPEADSSRHQKFTKWYSQERGKEFRGAKRHAYFIKYIKLIMTVLAVLLFAVILVWPTIFTPRETFNLKFSSIETEKADTPVMKNPRFQGVDSLGRPYNVIASEAVRVQEDLVDMKQVSGDITLEDRQWITLSSKTGRINTKTKKAKLVGDVNIISDDGFEFTTDIAFINLNNNSAHGKKPVVGQGPPGTLNATGFSITENGNTIFFRGPVKMIIFPGMDTGI